MDEPRDPSMDPERRERRHSGLTYSYYFCPELDKLAHHVAEYTTKQGFAISPDLIPEQLMLIVTEVAEAMEDFRDGKIRTVSSPKPEGLMSELADVLIRTLSLMRRLGCDNIAHEVAIKMVYNETRPHKHGRNC